MIKWSVNRFPLTEMMTTKFKYKRKSRSSFFIETYFSKNIKDEESLDWFMSKSHKHLLWCPSCMSFNEFLIAFQNDEILIFYIIIFSDGEIWTKKLKNILLQ